MSKEFRMEREVPYLSEEDFKKLFPQEYFSKYAEHLNILKFEQAIFQEALPAKAKQGFIEHRRGASMGNLHRLGKVKLNKYDPVGDTIAKNKVENARMEKFVRQLNHKLKEGPAKTAMAIRTPLVGYGQLPSSVLDKMRLIQNEQYAVEQQKLREKHRQDEFVKFKMRNHSTSSSKLSLHMMEQSILADSAESRSIRDPRQPPAITTSNTMQLHPAVITPPLQEQAEEVSRSLSYHQRLQRLVVQARSDVVGLNPEDRNLDVRYILALNRSIRKINCLEDQMRSQRRKRTVADWKTNQFTSKPHPEQRRQKKWKNLIEMTQNIRKQGEQIEMLSRYQDLLRQREFKEFLMQKEDKKTPPNPLLPP